MKKRVNKTIVIVTALLTFGAMGVTAKMHHDKYAQGENMQGHCMTWNACGSDEAATAVQE